MKRMKKIMALMLAAIMMMAMSVTAFAAETTHSLTVNVKGGQDLKGQTINLYKLFDVTESKSGETTNYAYTVNNTYKATLASVLNITETSKDEEFAAEVTKLGSDNSTGVQNFANTFTTKALEGKLAATATSNKIEESKTAYTFSNLAAGYYLVYVTGGERIPYEEATKQEPDTNIKPELSFTAKVLIVTIIVIFIGLMIAVIYSIRDRKRRKVR